MNYDYNQMNEEEKSKLFPYGIDNIKVIKVKDIAYYNIGRSETLRLRIRIVVDTGNKPDYYVYLDSIEELKEAVEILENPFTDKIAIITSKGIDSRDYITKVGSNIYDKAIESL